MLKKIVFATNNAHKLEEVRCIVGKTYEIVSLRDIGCVEEIPETADTLEGNALLKARYVHQRYGVDCFADDTGLEVTALNGAPGVYSARYAGEPSNAENNMQKLLSEMEGVVERKAQFRTVIALIIHGKEYLFEGKAVGTILEERRGLEGFGYDPLFVPEGYSESFAQLGDEVKNNISHRAEATRQLSRFLNTL